MNEPREYTEEEVREQFLDNIRAYVKYWDKLPDMSTRERLEGLAFSILAAIDGATAELPAFILAPLPHEEDKEYLRNRGKNWYPENRQAGVKADIARGLHELFRNHQKDGHETS